MPKKMTPADYVREAVGKVSEFFGRYRDASDDVYDTDTLQETWRDFLENTGGSAASLDDPGGLSIPGPDDTGPGVIDPEAPAIGGDFIGTGVGDADPVATKIRKSGDYIPGRGDFVDSTAFWAYLIPYIDATFNDTGTISANYFDIIPDVVWMSFVNGDSTAGLATPNDVQIYAQISEDNEFIDYNKLTEQENINGSFPFVIKSLSSAFSTSGDTSSTSYSGKYVAIMSLGAVSGIPYYTTYSSGTEYYTSNNVGPFKFQYKIDVNYRGDIKGFQSQYQKYSNETFSNRFSSLLSSFAEELANESTNRKRTLTYNKTNKDIITIEDVSAIKYGQSDVENLLVQSSVELATASDTEATTSFETSGGSGAYG